MTASPTSHDQGAPGPSSGAGLSLQPTLGDPQARAEAEPTGALIADRYETLRTLGQGGMGAVYLARDTKPGMGNREVAIKRILDADAQGVQRFLRESSTIAALNHQNIRAVHDRGEDDHGHYLVMEYVEGETLHDRVARDGALGDDAFLGLARGLAKALAFAHRKGVIHRDVKPANVLFAADGTPKLTDFGLARMGHDSDLSLTGYGMGTLDYASPEQRRDAKSADHRSDVYGLGATLYFAATGETPKTIRESRVPRRWRAVVLKCLEEKAEARYFSIDELLQEVSGSHRGPARSTPVPQAVDGAFACPSCDHPNPEDVKFCLSCGMGLFENCPKCGWEGRQGTTFCGSCGQDIPAWKDGAEHLAAAKKHLAAHAFGRAAKEARLALAAVPGMEEAQALAQEAKGKQEAARSARETARAHEEEEAFEQAEQPWRELLELVPDDEEALQALAGHPDRIRERDFRWCHETVACLLVPASQNGVRQASGRWAALERLASEQDRPLVDEVRAKARALRSQLIEQGLAMAEQAMNDGDLSQARARLQEERSFLEETAEALGADAGAMSALVDLDGRVVAKEEETWVRLRRQRTRRRLVIVVVVAALAGGSWLGWAGKDNQKRLEAAQAHLRNESPEKVGPSLAGIHLTGLLVNGRFREALTKRAELWMELRRAGGEGEMSRDLVDQLQHLDQSEAKIREHFGRWLKENAESVLTSLERGPWRQAEDAASAREAEDRARGLLEGLASLDLSESDRSNFEERAKGVSAEAREAREAREAAARRLNPFGWEVIDATPGSQTGAARRLRDPQTGITFILVEPGSFQMGSPASEEERGSDETQHRVTLTRAFYLGETAVTQAQWRKVMGSNPAHFQGDTLPVERVSWEACQEFCRKAGEGYRLPTEAEWEYACRAGSSMRFCFGDEEEKLGEYAWFSDNSGSTTHPVGQRKPNSWGFLDMHGNVWEWCQDRYGAYPSGPATDPSGPTSGDPGVLRGGSWYNYPRYCRSATRSWYRPDYQFDFVGFRAARTF